MIQLIAPNNKRLVWYLAMEEYVAQHVTEDTLFFWSVDPTVIFGRHQVIEDEVNLDFCQSHDVQFYRRKSGGGCVYADRGNLMLSYITPSTHSEQVFQYYLDMMSEALRKLDIPAVKSEHNDILIETNGETRKVSGNACYALPTGSIVHGTMLFDVDFAALQQAITPSREKLAKHGVQSVRQRVTNLRPLLDIHSIDDFARQLCDSICPSRRELTPSELDAIDELEKPYLDKTFIYGRNL